MMIIGNTGLIGSGKSVVMKLFGKLYNIPTYDSDQRAKEIYHEPMVREQIIEQMGIDPIGKGSNLNKEGLRELLGHTKKRALLEQIIHRGVSNDFQKWVDQQTAPMVIIESAILFTSGFYKFCQHTIRVTADEQIRRERVLARDLTMTVARFEQIVQLQEEEAKAQATKSEFTIDNNGHKSLIRQVELIHNTLTTKENLTQ